MRVRKQVAPDRYVKIGLQLYQVDQKSFLLDFRSFEGLIFKNASLSFFLKLVTNLSKILNSLFKEEAKMSYEENKTNSTTPRSVTPSPRPTTPISNESKSHHHNMMEFFELCAGLIGSLAR